MNSDREDYFHLLIFQVCASLAFGQEALMQALARPSFMKWKYDFFAWYFSILLDAAVEWIEIELIKRV